MRKQLSETQWKVTLTTGGQQVQNLEKNVEAPTQDAAIRRAMQSFPGMNFVQVQATSLSPQQTPPGTQQPSRVQTQLPQQMAGLRPLQGLMMPGQQQQQPAQQQPARESIDVKRFSFPYAVTLPVHFAKILRETSPCEVSEIYGQHKTVIENSVQMQEFLVRLSHSRNRTASGVILNGLRSSLKR